MVPDPSTLGRRKLLLGLGGLTASTGLAGVGVGLTRPTLLPDSVTDEWIDRYPTPPEVTSHWRPTVTEDHAAWAVDYLAETVATAERLDDRIDADRRFTGAGGWLEDARTELDDGNYHTALSHATYGMQFAAEDLGRAKARLDEVDMEALRAQSQSLWERADAVRASLDPYPVADPGVDLAWYYHVETEVLHARRLARWTLEEPYDYAPHTVGELVSRLRRSLIGVETAERYRDHLAERLEGPTTPYRTHLEGVAADLAASVGDVPSRFDVADELERSDVGEPYLHALSKLSVYCLPSTASGPWTESVPDDYRVVTAVGLSRGVAGARAYEFARDELVVDEDDEGFDAGHALAEKRRARDVYRSQIGSDPPPLLTRQASRAIEDLQVATVDHTDYRAPWRDRLDAYLYALVGRAKLKEHPTLYRIVADLH